MKLEKTSTETSNAKDMLNEADGIQWRTAKDNYIESIIGNYDAIPDEHKRNLVKLGLGIRLDRAFATAESKRVVVAAGTIAKSLDDLMSGSAGYTVKDIQADLLGYIVKLATSAHADKAQLLKDVQAAIINDGKQAKLDTLNRVRKAFSEAEVELAE